MDSAFLRPSARSTRIMSLVQEAPRKLFRALVSMGPELGTAHKMMQSKAVPDGLLPLECARRSRCGYPPIPYGGTGRGNEQNCHMPRSSLHWAR
jgi:hypothetical protein